MDDINVLVKDDSAGMPTADQAEKALNYIAVALSNREDFQKAWMGICEPDPMFVEVENVYRCLVAYLALMRMHEAKIEAASGHKPLQLTRCRSCQAGIVWLKTKSGKNMPVDADTWVQGQPPIFNPDLGHITHFATCPNADQHRKQN
jgi:hypothetical protein